MLSPALDLLLPALVLAFVSAGLLFAISQQPDRSSAFAEPAVTARPPATGVTTAIDPPSPGRVAGKALLLVRDEDEAELLATYLALDGELRGWLSEAPWHFEVVVVPSDSEAAGLAQSVGDQDSMIDGGAPMVVDLRGISPRVALALAVGK
ncbi:hypothetical protein AYO38_01420 [bacterium SCGC AG-212-C10]|nr:hypothetical protein AYO38_01420 [bacterium SCGC AG-212-C10]